MLTVLALMVIVLGAFKMAISAKWRTQGLVLLVVAIAVAAVVMFGHGVLHMAVH